MKRSILAALIVAFAVALAFALGTLQSQWVITDAEYEGLLKDLHNHEAKSLKGLGKMAVVMDRVEGNSFAADLATEKIRNDVETLLRTGKINVLVSEEQRKNTPGGPFLKVKIVGDSGTANNKLYSGFVKVALTQQVVLTRQITQAERVSANDSKYRIVADSKNVIYAETWHTQESFKDKDATAIRALVSDIVKRFVHDYAEANK